MTISATVWSGSTDIPAVSGTPMLSAQWRGDFRRPVAWRRNRWVPVGPWQYMSRGVA